MAIYSIIYSITLGNGGVKNGPSEAARLHFLKTPAIFAQGREQTMKLRRINGFDLLIALLLPLIIYYGFHLGLGQRQDSFRRDQFHIVFDGAMAVIIFITGVTSGLSMAIGNHPRKARLYMMRKAVLLLLIGALLAFCRVPEVFTLLGMLAMIGFFVLPLTSTLLRVTSTVLLIASFYLYFLTENRINITPYLHGVSAHLLLHHLAYGYYGFLPWAPFFISGALYSRRLLNRYGKPDQSGVFAGFVVVLLGFVLELFLASRFPNLTGIEGSPYPFVKYVHLTFPSFMMVSFGLSVIMSALATRIGEHPALKKASVVSTYGRMKYSVLSAALVAGCLADWYREPGGNFGYRTIFLFSLLVVVITFVATSIWTRFFSNGPIEMILRAITPKK